MAVKQKEAVFAAYTMGIENGMEHGSDALFTFVSDSVITGITSGEVEYGKDRSDENEVKSYGRQLTRNWFKKDERIAGAKYVPQTRRGPQVKDEQLKKLNTSLKSLRAHGADMELISKVEAKITARKNELASEKAQSKVQSLDETLAQLAELGIEA